MRSFLISFAAGVCYLQMRATLPGTEVLLLLLTLLLMLLFLSRVVSRPQFKIPTLLACGAIAGFAWAAYCAQHYLADALPKDLEGRDIVLVGTVHSLPFRFPQGVRFNFAVESAQIDGKPISSIPSKIALSWYASSRAGGIPPAEVQPGERWQLAVHLQRPHGNANIGGFDYEVWLLEQDLRATGTVRMDDEACAATLGAGGPLCTDNRRLAPFVWSFNNVVERARGWMRDRIVAALPDKKYAGVIVALVVGDERGVNQTDWKVFNRTGIGHLIAISGLHITLIAGMCARLMYALWSHSFFTRAELPLLLPAHKAAALTGVLIGFIYVLLAGFGVPAQRTLYMLAVVATAMWFGRLASISHIACIALGVVLLLDPWAVLWPGFWLSFGCVAIILYATMGRTLQLQTDASPAMQPRPQRWLNWLKMEGRTQ
ncbi:MAG TPA: ComEC/Rec2 family competence protein, partial [Burkholderiaceae bacterium]|nr:ComEC/Rec2 family competence protein [Burkholderiaceae bacterium]